MSSKRSKSISEWICNGSDIQKIRNQWIETSNSNLPILIIGEGGVGKSFWIQRSLEQRNISPSHLVNFDFSYPFAFSESLEKIKTSKQIVTILIDRITKAKPEEVLLLQQWWKSEKYEEKSKVYLYWEIHSEELEILNQKNVYSDFYDQLKSFRFELPNLKKRISELPFFVSQFLEEANTELGKKISGIEEEFFVFFKNKSFTKNFSELRDMIFALVGFSTGKQLYWKQIPSHFFENHLSELEVKPGISLESYEKEIIKANLIYTKGNREKAAKLLGISERNLYRKLHEYHLEDLS
ncbi:transcriptional regulator [Leptospira sp. 2 VSF19]|uniref:Transcriptional regulator n=1 Tax=Leptospira soteropolitanensis TaxID=2950025 RepID=A0AAW5VBX0_9LEPT|nr:helix-turn-helix domain-containing protein [Leptospira soteropolitanensis]MCW7491561.1 transcriptional regulator [Leptospira soteropolitanensis]MCW7499145.1 transcriptional regulator [Leptospira soteropolitanensis]MCW7521263.1 transcriptional regulator [Leptospira soteropolitanensis]MCW7525249.1 transcriptional regulator [Leptospira soteropolitanensis]MCW7529116.1 transcriptional regulator [Leptospira soteropolitanensis]